MEIDLPDVTAEVKAAFARYEQALVSNDVDTLNTLFRDDTCTIRYGGAENLYGYGQIKAFRAARSPADLERTLFDTVITTYGRDFAVASTLFRRPTISRQDRSPDADLGAVRRRLACRRRACQCDRRITACRRRAASERARLLQSHKSSI